MNAPVRIDLKTAKAALAATVVEPIAMRVEISRPPLWDAIDAQFNVSGKPILFAFGGVIFNPMNVKIPHELVRHEGVHGARQLAMGNTIAWWGQYIIDPAFRLQEELPAHVAEFKSLCEQHAPSWTSQRAMRRHMAHHVATKLAAPLYGSLITRDQAKKLLLAA